MEKILNDFFDKDTLLKLPITAIIYSLFYKLILNQNHGFANCKTVSRRDISSWKKWHDYHQKHKYSSMQLSIKK